jgi:hypothetical protein
MGTVFSPDESHKCAPPDHSRMLVIVLG